MIIGGKSRARSLTALVSLGAVVLLAESGWSAPPAPDVEVLSLATSHSKLAPGGAVALTFVLRATGASVGPFNVGAYYGEGNGKGKVPRDATLLTKYAIGRGLPKDEKVAFTLPVRVPPCDACGAHAIYVVADVDGVVAETNRDNDVRSVSLDVKPEYLPDLRVGTVTVDKDRGSTSDRVSVRATIQNDSRYHAEGPFRVSVYCSAAATPRPRDQRLFSFMVPSLSGGASLSVDRAVQLRPECGVYAATTWIGVLADDQQAVPETNEQNDANAVPYWVLRAPDLTSHAVSLSASAGPVGSRVLLSYRIDNQGDSAAGAFRAGVYLSRAGEPPPKGTLLDTVDVPSLAAHTNSGAMQHLVTIPKVPRGRYSLGVWVGTGDENGELRRRNNFLSEAYDVTEVNLTDVHFTAGRKAVDPDSPLELKFAVKNTGRDPAPASKVGLYYSSDPRLDRDEDTRVGEVTVERLAAGAASREKSVTVTVPKGAREGYGFVLAVMDDGDDVAETDERDNVALEPILVGAPKTVARTE